jgi:hypothetical protein
MPSKKPVETGFQLNLAGDKFLQNARLPSNYIVLQPRRLYSSL